jgi:hypothetical protein
MASTKLSNTKFVDSLPPPPLFNIDDDDDDEKGARTGGRSA